MSKTEASTPTTSTSAEAPKPPDARDVAEAISKVVGILSHLPPALQLRALGGAATALGVDKESRTRTSTSAQQQRGNTNQQNRTSNGGGSR